MVSDSFPFIQLAAEIRLPIYKLVLPYSTYCSKLHEHDSPIKWHYGKCPGILFVNRQIHREAAELLYSQNIFAIYVRHPREPRLPMNESRADPESFMLISWANRTWSNPKNPRLPISLLRNHSNFENIRRLHVSLPHFDDLSGVDMFMKKTSYAAFHGINGWIRKCAKDDGRLDAQERERMEYIKQFKEPLDEIGKLLHILPRVDQLNLSLSAGQFDISFIEYLLDGILQRRNVRNAACFYYRPSGTINRREFGIRDYSLLQRLNTVLQSPPGDKRESHLQLDIEGMFWLLQSIRTRQQLDPLLLPKWLEEMAP
ncbi:hypothetical protein MMC28_000985 [Mycoblastus sanguinarius]|nr:hypothetical protein [Mycoblastus sanguinarius]